MYSSSRTSGVMMREQEEGRQASREGRRGYLIKSLPLFLTKEVERETTAVALILCLYQ